jgi:hypothetical protein
MLGKWPIPNKLSGKVAPGCRTLDQESPGWPSAAFGSSPGGATRRSDTTSVGRAFSFLRPLLPFLLPFLHCAGRSGLELGLGQVARVP